MKESGEQCVIIVGDTLMLWWYADNWDFLQVSVY